MRQLLLGIVGQDKPSDVHKTFTVVISLFPKEDDDAKKFVAFRELAYLRPDRAQPIRAFLNAAQVYAKQAGDFVGR